MNELLEPNFNGLPKPTDWTQVIIPLQQANEKEFRGATLPELGANLKIEMSVNAQRIPSVPPGALVAGPDDREVFMEIKEPGSWTWGVNPPLTNIQGDISTFWWNKIDWKKNDRAALPMPQGVAVLNPTGNGLPTEKATADYAIAKQDLMTGQNTYKPQEDIDGYYVQATTGELYPNSTSSVSKIYPTVPGKNIWIDKRTGNAGIRFLNSSGGQIPPLDLNGNQFSEGSLYQPPYLNGGYKSPLNSVGYQFTSKFTGTTNKENITVTDSPSSIPQVKPELIPDTPKVLAVEAQSKQNTDYIVGLNSVAPTERINKGENSTTPQYFGKATEAMYQFGIDIVSDTESPVKAHLPYMRKFTTTLSPDQGTNYRIASINVGLNRPTQMDFSFWTKKSQFQAIFTTEMTTYLGLCNHKINVTQLLAGSDVIAVRRGSYPAEYESVVCKAKIIAEQNGWIRISINYSAIVWRTTFTGTVIPYYFMFNLASPNGKQFYFTDFTVLFGERAKTNVIYPSNSDNLSSNVVSLNAMNDRIDSVNKRLDEITNDNNLPVHINYSGGQIYVATEWDTTKNLVRRSAYDRASGFFNNPNINLTDEYLSEKSANDPKMPLSIVKVSGDDICPANIHGSYIGGNHGWNHAKILTLLNHGKSHYDVGAVYTDSSGKDFVILRVIDIYQMWICSLNTATDGFTYNFIAPVGTLVYKENGRDTISMSSYSISGIGNLYPSISPSSKKILLDGQNLVTTSGDYYANWIDVVETYNMYDLPSIIASVRSNRPTGGYIANPIFNQLTGLEVIAKHNIVYRFLADGTTLISQSFVALKKLNFSFHGFTQSFPMEGSKLYIPKALPITAGAKTYDFRKIEDWSTGPSASIYLTQPYWENAQSPPDRIINISPTAIYSTGYITDRGKGINRKDNVSDSIFLYTSKKLYPKGDSIARIMQAFESSSMVAYRSLKNPSINPVGRTNIEIIELDNTVIINVDYHGALLDYIKTDHNWIGKKIEIIEKSNNITLLSDIVSGVIEIASSATDQNYGYITLKII